MAFGGISDRRILRSRPVKVRGNDAIRTRCIGLGTRSIWPSVPSLEWINGARDSRQGADGVACDTSSTVRSPPHIHPDLAEPIAETAR